jgi:glycosyltransferase involved in cell wall biosynthesis
MTSSRPFFSICIPAYNRARHLRPLLDSILAQEFTDHEIVICEDVSPERPQIAAIVREYQERHPGRIVYHENGANLGYDGNVRELVARARGRYCFFMGNDDLLCPGALAHVHAVAGRHPDVGFVLKSYAWFDGTPDAVNQEVRYFGDETFLAAGPEAVRVCFRRSGVISGYVVRRDDAHAAATAEFDGTLYYQMHLTATVLARANAVATPMVLVLCRNGEPPDFGNSASEKGKYTPGRYTPEARLNMIGGAMRIARAASRRTGVAVDDAIVKDYANYFYPYIRDQLTLPLRDYLRLWRGFSAMGFGRHPLFHVYFVLGYLLGEGGFDRLTRMVRRALGRSPQFGLSKSR